MREIILPEIVSYRLPEGTKNRLLAVGEPFESIASTGRRAILEWLDEREKTKPRRSKKGATR